MTGQANQRTTKQRIAVAEILDQTEEFRTAQDLHDILRHRGTGIGLTTVYRNLQALVESGQVDAIRRADGEAAYRRCSPSHHHHLVCRQCGATVEVGDEAVETWAAKVASQHGFSDVTHTVEVHGVCAACAKPA